MSIESEEYHIASGLSDASIIIGIVLNSPKAKSLLSRFTSKSLYTTHIYRRFRGVRTVYPSPRNREIGFVSSSFSFRACRACRACGRGEAAGAHVDRCP